jgi:hypothetical protein
LQEGLPAIFNSTKVNHSIDFRVLVFLLLLALLLLFSGSAIISWGPQSAFESGKTIERAAVEKATLVNPHAVGLFPDPTGIKVSMVDQRVDFAAGVPLNESMRKLRVVPSYPKDHVHSRFNVKMVYQTRIAANPATQRSNSQPAGFFLGLAHQFGAFASHLQFPGAAGWFVHKDALFPQTNRRPRKEMRINERMIRSWLTSSFRPARSVGLGVRARKGRRFALR